MIGVDRLHHQDELDEGVGVDRVRMADLTDFYPGATQASVNGAGKAANPAQASSIGGSAGAPVHHQPALVVLALVAVSLILLHHAG